MTTKTSEISLEKLDNWEVQPDPRKIHEIAASDAKIITENFFSKRKKKTLFLWGLILTLIIFGALKGLLNINLIEFFRELSSFGNIPYFAATIIIGLLTFWVCEVWIRVYVIRQKLKLRNVSRKDWVSFSLIAFLIQSVTPFSIGSEPYNIWWLTKKGVPVKDATAATAASSICWFFAQFIVTWPSFIYLSVKNWDKISTFQIANCYWMVLAGLIVDIVVSCFIFVISYSSSAHFWISKIVNDIKRQVGFSYLTRDELFHKYLQNSTFKNLYIRYLWNTSTIRIIIIYILSNLWIYFLFAFSHRLFLYQYWDEVSSTWNSYHIINIATTSNNFLPLPSAEGSLQAVLQSMMKHLVNFSFPSSVSPSENDLQTWNNYTIFTWRLFSKYLGLVIVLFYLSWLGIKDWWKRRSKQVTSFIKKGIGLHQTPK